MYVFYLEFGSTADYNWSECTWALTPKVPAMFYMASKNVKALKATP